LHCLSCDDQVDVGWVFGDIFFCVLVVGCNRLLGDKSPFTQQALLGDGADRDEEAARIQYLAEIAKFLGLTTTVDPDAIQVSECIISICCTNTECFC
jgi:hypothetical protein